MNEDLELFPNANPPATTAQDVIKATCDALDCPVPSAHKAIIGNHAKALLADGFEYEIVVIAAVTALRRGTPQHMQYVASDLVMAMNGQRMSRREYEKALEDAAELRKG